MEKGIILIGRVTKSDIMKANKKASREMNLENSTGWVCVRKSHKSEKDYNRKKKTYSIFE
jgi:hypothetical protein